MNRLTKRVFMNALFMGIITTPTIAFDHVRTSDGHSVKAARKEASELQKIGESLRAWPAPKVDSVEVDTETSLVATPQDEDEEKEFVIRGLDRIFFDYVMKTYVHRLRRPRPL